MTVKTSHVLPYSLVLRGLSIFIKLEMLLLLKLFLLQSITKLLLYLEQGAGIPGFGKHLCIDLYFYEMTKTGHIKKASKVAACVHEDLLHVAVGRHQPDVIGRAAVDASLVPEHDLQQKLPF